jgi:antitoxin HigA-1
MIPENRISTHPGEILREEFLLPLGMSGAELAHAIAVPANRITDIIRERRGVTADTAIRLGRYFGTSAEFWLTAQASFELTSALAEHKRDYDAISPRAA